MPRHVVAKVRTARGTDKRQAEIGASQHAISQPAHGPGMGWFLGPVHLVVFVGVGRDLLLAYGLMHLLLEHLLGGRHRPGTGPLPSSFTHRAFRVRPRAPPVTSGSAPTCRALLAQPPGVSSRPVSACNWRSYIATRAGLSSGRRNACVRAKSCGATSTGSSTLATSETTVGSGARSPGKKGEGAKRRSDAPGADA